MANEDLKKDILDGVAQLLEPIHDQLDDHSERLTRLEEMGETVDSNHASLLRIEQILNSYGEMYQVNKSKNDQLDRRVTRIEDHLDLPSIS